MRKTNFTVLLTKVLVDVSYSLKKLRKSQVSLFVMRYHEYRKVWKAEGNNILEVQLEHTNKMAVISAK